MTSSHHHNDTFTVIFKHITVILNKKLTIFGHKKVPYWFLKVVIIKNRIASHQSNNLDIKWIRKKWNRWKLNWKRKQKFKWVKTFNRNEQNEIYLQYVWDEMRWDKMDEKRIIFQTNDKKNNEFQWGIELYFPLVIRIFSFKKTLRVYSKYRCLCVYIHIFSGILSHKNSLSSILNLRQRKKGAKNEPKFLLYILSFHWDVNWKISSKFNAFFQKCWTKLTFSEL